MASLHFSENIEMLLFFGNEKIKKHHRDFFTGWKCLHVSVLKSVFRFSFEKSENFFKYMTWHWFIESVCKLFLIHLSLTFYNLSLANCWPLATLIFEHINRRYKRDNSDEISKPRHQKKECDTRNVILTFTYSIRSLVLHNVFSLVIQLKANAHNIISSILPP